MVSGERSASRACPSDETVARFLSGDLPEEEEKSFRVHVDGCDACRKLLAEAGAGADTGATRISPIAAAHNVTPLRAAPGDVIGDKYRVDAFLGEGGMGTVYRSWHLGLGRTVAIKIMHPELLSAELARRFAREARAAASLTSDHAVRILDIDHMPSGVPYIVMEHLEGRDLHAVLAEEGPLHWERAVRYVIEACDAVGEAHARGIVHRDLKPHNLFLTSSDVVKVLDFGLAKRLPQTQTGAASSSHPRSTGFVGSPQTMAPEQIRGGSTIDARTDVYGLGATLYQLLAGAAPFVGLNLYVLCARILSEPPAPIARQHVPRAVEAVVLQCLAKEQDARPPTIEALAAALAEATATARRGDAAPSTALRVHPASPVTLREQDIVTAAVREPPTQEDATQESALERTLKLPRPAR